MKKYDDEKRRFSPEAIEFLCDPRRSLLRYGKIMDQEENGQLVPYDPYRLTDKCQATILHYMADPPKDENNRVLWLVLVAGRQTGKSVTAEYAAYTRAAYIPNWEHVCMADTRERAEYLHKRVHTLHDEWPENVRAAERFVTEVRQKTFSNGATMRTLYSHTDAAGIGQSFDSFHGSELPFWAGAAQKFALLLPAILNRKNARMLLESTPAPMDHPSAEWWRDTVFSAFRRENRYILGFFPYWDSKAARRIWHNDWVLEQYELEQLEKYGHLGLTRENLAFRREVLTTIDEFKKNPELFDVYYPSDIYSCWGSRTSGIIPYASIAKACKDLHDWNPKNGYQEYSAPILGTTYVIGVDPVGFAARNHAAFHVLETWEDSVEQAAAYADFTDPITFAKILFDTGMRYNRALIVVESTGVGQAVLSQLVVMKYPNLYYHEEGNPGMPAVYMDELMTLMISLMDTRLIIRDGDTRNQLQSYKDDKKVEKTERLLILQRTESANRRRRHHWDKVSALLYACYASTLVSQKKRPQVYVAKMWADMSYSEIQRYRRSILKPGSTSTYYRKG